MPEEYPQVGEIPARNLAQRPQPGIESAACTNKRSKGRDRMEQNTTDLAPRIFRHHFCTFRFWNPRRLAALSLAAAVSTRVLCFRLLMPVVINRVDSGVSNWVRDQSIIRLRRIEPL